MVKLWYPRLKEVRLLCKLYALVWTEVIQMLQSIPVIFRKPLTQKGETKGINYGKKLIFLFGFYNINLVKITSLK